MAKYQLKPGIVLTFCGQTYNQGTMTDEIAADVIAKFPKLAAQFNIKEDVPEKEIPAQEAPQKIKRVRKPKQ